MCISERLKSYSQILFLIILTHTTLAIFPFVSGENLMKNGERVLKVYSVETSTTDPIPSPTEGAPPTENEVDGNDTLLQSNDPKKVGFYLYSDKE